ncbi:UPF0058 family protein [Halorussus pelagicus]|uniref:UPF0058 family protein n=1 Tax=Halorussus pelagicus TaxID=2505977 RepID=UPI000FFC4BF0|nr:UPF0058 family protein [Halorussus pelagicus]
MQKAELVYLHALLAKIHEYLAVRHDVPETFERYETDDIGPYQVQFQKDAHEAAVRLLGEFLADELSGDDENESLEVELRET